MKAEGEAGSRPGLAPGGAGREPGVSVGISRYERVSRVSGHVALVIGGLAIVAWLSGLHLIPRIDASLSPIAFNSALCLLLAGASLELRRARHRFPRIVSVGCAAAVTLIGGLTLFEYLSGIGLGLDVLFYWRSPVQGWAYVAGRMSPTSALCHTMVGSVLLLHSAERRWLQALRQGLTVLLGGIALLSLVGYLYSIAQLIQLSSFKPISIPAAVGFGLLFLSLFLARPDRGLAALYTSDTVGGLMLRRLIIFVVFLPILLGAVVAGMVRSNLLEASTPFLLLVVATILTFSGLFWITSYTINKTESRRREAEQALRDSEDTYGTLCDSARDAIFTFELTGRFLNANAVACQQFGHTREELAGLSLQELAGSEYARAILDHIEELEQVGHVCFEAPHNGPDGGEVHLEVSAQIVRRRTPTAAVAIARDLTQRLKLEAELRQAQKMEAIGRLAGGVAHDFNNLLTVITGRCDMALEGMDEGSPARRDIEEIMHASGRAASLTGQLLAFSRKQVLQPRIIDLNALIENMKTMLRRLIGEHIELATSLAPRELRVTADPGQMEQVVMNLAINARDAMASGGRLGIQTEAVRLPADGRCQGAEPGEYVAVAVRDTGCGMDKDTLSRIFEPFFTTKERGKGTGLGLSTAYGIVKQSKGYITVSSEPGQGTTFEVFLPRVPEQAASEALQWAGPEMRGSLDGRETILLVEDDTMVRNLTGEMLRKHGHTVIEASNGLEALTVCRDSWRKVDIVVTDVVMPAMGGRELIQRLGGLAPELKVILVSGYLDEQDGFDEAANMLQKPFDSDVLLRAIRDVLAGRKISRPAQPAPRTAAPRARAGTA